VLITISTTGIPGHPASDLGFLLHKHPDRQQTFATAHGLAHVFYPEADDRTCTAALLLEVDPIALVRRGRGKGRGGSPDFALAQYVNDRPYAASSLLAVALGKVFATALRGRCDLRPELAASALPLSIAVPALPAQGEQEGGPELVRRLFEPLGWQVAAEPVPLDERFPEWGDSRYVRLRLTGTLRLADALSQLYVLLPALDGSKHYWVAPDEVDKLLRAGDGWLADHPEAALITRRYLARRRSLARAAMEQLELARLAEADDREVEELSPAAAPDADDPDAGPDAVPGAVPGAGPDAASGTDAVSGTADAPEAKPVTLAAQRRAAILEALRAVGATRVADLGCGEGTLVAALLKEGRVTEVLGVDVSTRSLAVAARRLHLERMTERQARRVRLVQGALTYVDDRIAGYDAAVLSEVIEHVDLDRLPALEHAVFGAARPGTVVVTTPNAEYNVRWESLPAGHVRHADHRFEWDRSQFRRWAEQVAERYGYTVALAPVGPDDPEVGPPTQLAVFHRSNSPAGATP
jgi:SAM-dependent methyltransferase